MRVKQIDLEYRDEKDVSGPAPAYALLGAKLHLASHTMAGTEVFREVDLAIEDVRELERLLNRALQRMTQEVRRLI